MVHFQAQRPTNLDSALQVAQHMETVMKTLSSKSSKTVRAVVQRAGDPRVDAELRDFRAGQRHLLELLQQLGRADQVSRERSNDSEAERERSSAAVADRNTPRGEAGTVGERGQRARLFAFAAGARGTPHEAVIS